MCACTCACVVYAAIHMHLQISIIQSHAALPVQHTSLLISACAQELHKNASPHSAHHSCHHEMQRALRHISDTVVLRRQRCQHSQAPLWPGQLELAYLCALLGPPDHLMRVRIRHSAISCKQSVFPGPTSVLRVACKAVQLPRRSRPRTFAKHWSDDLLLSCFVHCRACAAAGPAAAAQAGARWRARRCHRVVHHHEWRKSASLSCCSSAAAVPCWQTGCHAH